MIWPDVLVSLDIRLIGLRRQDRLLQRDQRGIGGLQAAVNLLVEVHVLLVVVEPEAGKQPQAIGHRPLELAEQRRAGIPILDVLVVAVAVEKAGCRRVGARRQKKGRRRGALFLLEDRIRVERLAEREGADDKVQAARHIFGVANLLRPLPLLRRRGRDRGHRQADEIAVARGIPIPVAPGGGRVQPARPKLPVDRQRGRRRDPDRTARASRRRSAGRRR